ncbi:MAG: IS110 family transposase [Betaproteobacteria bacterium]
MDTVAVYVGLDYHDESVQVCVMNRDGQVLANTGCHNDRRAIVDCVHRYGRCVQAAVESCTGAANLADELVAIGWQVSLSHPGFVRRMKQSPDKTDWHDAQVLADLVRIGYLPKVWLAPEFVRELRQLVRYRQQLADQRRATKLRIRAVLRQQRVRAPGGINAWTKRWQNWLRDEAALSVQGRWVIEQHVRELDSLVRRLVDVAVHLQSVCATDPEYLKLRSQVGIGPVTAWTLRAEVGRFDRFRTGKQLARFCGLSPRNASSGQKQADAGLIRAANPQLRTVLIEAGHRLCRSKSPWRQLALRLRNAGKPGSVVAAAVANRYVRALYHQMLAA